MSKGEQPRALGQSLQKSFATRWAPVGGLFVLEISSAAAPDVPTTDEAGLPDFHTSVWSAIWAPKGTPKEVIGKLNAAIVAALADPVTRRRLTDLGGQILPDDEHAPETLRAFHKSEIEKWWPIIKAVKGRGCAPIALEGHHMRS
jgi:tripartite-type tricarboxylate transporter receptor subunit TctC